MELALLTKVGTYDYTASMAATKQVIISTAM
jgi:hypothetical protein